VAKKKDPDYTVGYGKPPKHSQFKPGKSGNPKGRPKKTGTITDAFLKVGKKVVPVPTQDGIKRMSMKDLLAAKHWGMAVNGDHKSSTLVLDVLQRSEVKQDNHLDDLLLEFREKNARIVETNKGSETERDEDDPLGPEGKPEDK
jgi:hypothetical protein